MKLSPHYSPTTEEPHEEQWEYVMAVASLYGSDDVHQTLNLYGSRGWELVSTPIPSAGDFIRFFFKRRKK